MGEVRGAADVLRNFLLWTSGARQAGYQVAQQWAHELAEQARYEAEWQDVTGEARALLNAVAAIVGPEGTSPMPPVVQMAMGGFPSAECIVIVVSGDSDHSGYLELDHGQQYAVVWPLVLGAAGVVTREISNAIVEHQQNTPTAHLGTAARTGAAEVSNYGDF